MRSYNPKTNVLVGVPNNAGTLEGSTEANADSVFLKDIKHKNK